MLEPDYEVIREDDFQDTDGHQFRPSIADLPSNENTTQRAPKKNYKEEFDITPFCNKFRFQKII